MQLLLKSELVNQLWFRLCDNNFALRYNLTPQLRTLMNSFFRARKIYAGVFLLYLLSSLFDAALAELAGSPVLESVGVLTALALLHPSYHVKASGLVAHVVTLVLSAFFAGSPWPTALALTSESLGIAFLSYYFLKEIAFKRKGEIAPFYSALYMGLTSVGAPLIVGFMHLASLRTSLPLTALLESMLPNIASALIWVPIGLTVVRRGFLNAMSKAISNNQMSILAAFSVISFIAGAALPYPPLILGMIQLFVATRLTFSQGALTSWALGLFNAYLFAADYIMEPGRPFGGVGPYYGYLQIFAVSGLGAFAMLISTEVRRLLSLSADKVVTLETLFASSPAMLVTITGKGDVLRASARFLQRVGKQQKDISAATIQDLFQEGTALLEELGRDDQNASVEGLVKVSKGEAFPSRILFSKTVLEKPPYEVFNLVVEDISAQKLAESKVSTLVQTDPITGLFNQEHFEGLLLRRILKYETSKEPFTVLTMGLQGLSSASTLVSFKVLNNYLREIGQVIKSNLRTNDVVSKGNAFEYLILLDRVTNPPEIDLIFRKIQKAIDEVTPTLAPELLSTVFSAGVARFPVNALTPTELMSCASLAYLRAGKESRGPCLEYFDELQDRAPYEGFQQQKEIRDAIPRQEFGLVYQPKIHTLTGSVDSIEALLRWNRPGLPPVAPAEFLGTAITHNLMDVLGAQAIRESCLQMKAWLDAHIRLKSISVNVSAQELWHEDFCEKVKQILAETQLDGRYLELEIQEQTLLKAPLDAKNTFNKLRGMGVALTLSTSGIGGPLLQFTKTFPFSKLKLEKSILRFAFKELQHHKILESIIAAAKVSELMIIVEGVESEEQATVLTDLHVDFMQGYHFGAPIHADLMTTSLMLNRRALRQV